MTSCQICDIFLQTLAIHKEENHVDNLRVWTLNRAGSAHFKPKVISCCIRQVDELLEIS